MALSSTIFAVQCSEILFIQLCSSDLAEECKRHRVNQRVSQGVAVQCVWAVPYKIWKKGARVLVPRQGATSCQDPDLWMAKAALAQPLVPWASSLRRLQQSISHRWWGKAPSDRAEGRHPTGQTCHCGCTWPLFAFHADCFLCHPDTSPTVLVASLSCYSSVIPCFMFTPHQFLMPDIYNLPSLSARLFPQGSRAAQCHFRGTSVCTAVLRSYTQRGARD